MGNTVGVVSVYYNYFFKHSASFSKRYKVYNATFCC